MFMFSEKRYNRFIFIVSALVSVLIHFPDILTVATEGGSESSTMVHATLEVLSEILFSFVALLLMFACNIYLFKLNNHLVRFTAIRVLLSFLITWVISAILGKIFVFFHHSIGIPAIDSTLHHYYHPVRDMLLAAVITTICSFLHLLMQQEKLQEENRKLRMENVENKYESLKNQLNPHMFFNSLNTLQALVREDPDKAQHYINELSKVLRYTLQQSDQQCASLSSEIALAKAYIYLLEVRYEDNITFHIDIDDTYLEYQLPPISIQHLIENAVKHNEISSRNQLEVTLETRPDGCLHVFNTIHARRAPLSRSGIGLENLSKRYKLLFHEEIEISKTNNLFTVKLPLIKRVS